jgi:uncharacterized protein with PIN domain
MNTSSKDPELRKLEAQLQEAQQQAFSLQAQMKLLTAVERMKRSQEQRTVQQQITALQGKVMEVTQKLQPVQDEACKVFEEIDGQRLTTRSSGCSSRTTPGRACYREDDLGAH